MGYRIFNVRTWSFLCVCIHNGVGHTDSESAQKFWRWKTLVLLMGFEPRSFGSWRPTFYQVSHPVTTTSAANIIITATTTTIITATTTTTTIIPRQKNVPTNLNNLKKVKHFEKFNHTFSRCNANKNQNGMKRPGVQIPKSHSCHLAPAKESFWYQQRVWPPWARVDVLNAPAFCFFVFGRPCEKKLFWGNLSRYLSSINKIWIWNFEMWSWWTGQACGRTPGE